MSMEEVKKMKLCFGMAWDERRHTCFEKRSMFALFHSSFFCFILTGKNGYKSVQK